MYFFMGREVRTLTSMRVLTCFGTALFVEQGSGKLRHGPVDTIPHNVSLKRDRDRGLLVCEEGGVARPIRCTADGGMTALINGDATATPVSFDIEALRWSDRDWFGLKARNLFLCADPAGDVHLSRQHLQAWERFTLAIPRSKEVFDALTLLKPYDVLRHRKLRIGDTADGGYVLLDDLANVEVVYSFGVGPNVSFDAGMASLGKQIVLFDHTVPGPPIDHPNFRFFKQGVAATDSDDGSLLSVQHHIERLGHAGRDNLLLKMDVEGAELDVFAAMSHQTLRHFRQITLELHWLHRLEDGDYRAVFVEALRNLNSLFTLFHVHANNSRGIALIDGYVVADVLELSFIRSDLAERVESRTIYPTELDYANWPALPDHLLWFYPFLPMSTDLASQPTEKFLTSVQASNRLRS